MTTAGNASEEKDIPVLDAEFVESDAPAARRKPRWGLRIGWATAAILAIFIAGLFAASAVDRGLAWFGLSLPRPDQPVTSQAAASPDLTEVLAGLDRLDGRIGTLETALGEIDTAVESNRRRLEDLAAQSAAVEGGQAESVTAGAVEALTGRIAALEDRVGGLADRLAEAPAGVEESEVIALRNALSDAVAARQRLSGRLDSINRRLAALETARRGERVRPSLAVALAPLSRAIDRGRPFAAELAAVREAVDEAAGPSRSAAATAIDALAPHADTGISGLAALTGAFSAMARAVNATAATPADAETGFWSTLGRRLGSVVSVRRVDESAQGRDRILADAEAALARGDLAAAVAALETLDGAAAEAAASWIERARARLEAEAALTDLVALASGPARPAPPTADSEEP